MFIKHELSKSKGKSVLGAIIFSIAGFVLAYYGANPLSDIYPIWGYISFLGASSIIVGLWVSRIIGWIWGRHRFVRTAKLMVVLVSTISIWVTAPSYIDLFVRPQGTIEMPTFVNDSTQVTVHYGTRQDDYFWSQQTIGELKQKPYVSLNVNGENIFTVHFDDRRLYVDAQLFAGYTNQIVPDYLTIGSLSNFSIETAGYFNMDKSSGVRALQKKTMATEVKNRALAPPVIIKNNSLQNAPAGWKVYQTNSALEVDNEHGLPMLLLEYKNPYEIMLSGLFLTPLGILKVDNTKDIIFEFADSPFELDVYRVSRLHRPSILDWVRPETVYILLDKGRR